MTKTVTKIGPADHGKHMSLAEFEHAHGQEGYLYELSRGAIAVMDVPKPKHLLSVVGVRNQLVAYQLAHPEAISIIAGGFDCKLLIWDLESERHPDITVYLTMPPTGNDVWSRWLPELVIEVVSRSSRRRDYFEKREEYLALGVKEYWIIDPERQLLLALRRVRGKWKEITVKHGEKYETALLSGFSLDLDRVFGQ
jgi:Uma2 family endonuclease